MNIGLDKISKKRIYPKKGAIAICQCCGTNLIPKCGKIKVHHWAHENKVFCDKWWESETEWHRKWKNEFPTNWQEIIITDNSKEKHIADVFNPFKKLVIEFQNSPIQVDEIISRELFYKKMIWVINAGEFNIKTYALRSAKQILKNLEIQYLGNPMNDLYLFPKEIAEMLLNESATILRYPRIRELQIEKLYKMFNEQFEILFNKYNVEQVKEFSIQPTKLRKKLIQPIFDKLKIDINRFLDIDNLRIGEAKYYRYKWIRKRKVWDYANKEVFLDKGNNLLWLKSDWTLKEVSRIEFIEHYRKVK